MITTCFVQSTKLKRQRIFLKSCVLSWHCGKRHFRIQVVSVNFILSFLFALQSVLIFSVAFATLLCVILFANFLYAQLSVMVIAYCNVGSLCRLLNALIFARYYNGFVWSHAWKLRHGERVRRRNQFGINCYCMPLRQNMAPFLHAALLLYSRNA